jgi:Lrp/AsnC family transcriptional regulator
MAGLDRHDLAMLRIVQTDSTLPLAELADRVGLSTTPCWRRMQRLRNEGVIAREVAILSPDHIGFSALVFAQIKLSAHGRANLAEFTAAVRELPEVQECFSLMGDFDFLLRVLMRDLKEYETFFFSKLSGLPGVQEVRSSVALSTIKSTTVIAI